MEVWFSTYGFSTLGIMTPEGHAKVKTNDLGQFSVPKIAVGQLRVGFGIQPKGATALPRIPDRLAIVEGATAKFNIRLETPVLVQGTIRTDDTDKPIPGAEIHLGFGTGFQGEQVVSDADGHYEARVLSGPVRTTNEMGEFVAQIPKTITLESYEAWLEDDSTRLTPTVEKADPLILRVTIPRP